MFCYVKINMLKHVEKKEKTQFQEQCSLYIVRNRSELYVKFSLYIVRNRSEPFWTIYTAQTQISSD